MKLIELIEGIVGRTSQHDKREEGAIDVIGKTISNTFITPGFRVRPTTIKKRRLDNFEDTLVTLAAFLQVKDNQPLDWFFQNRFDELRIKPKDRPPYSPHMKNALIYLAQRYNQIESESEDNVQDSQHRGAEERRWYYDIVDRIEKKMNEGSHQS